MGGLYSAYLEFADLLKEKGYKNSYLLTDVFDFLRPKFSGNGLRVRELWGDLPEEIDLYVHVPFCTSVCHFCMYNSRVTKDEHRIKKYVDTLCKEIDFFAKLFAGVKVKSLYIGGGTPSILSEQMIEQLFSHLSVFDYLDGERTFECNPETVTREKLLVLQRHGISRVSFGVQSLNEEVLLAENRGRMMEKHVRDAVGWAKELGFEVNLDIMLGLAHGDVDDVVQTFERVGGLGVDFISVYPIQPTSVYLKRFGSLEAFEKQLDGVVAAFKEKADQLASDFGFNVQAPSLVSLREGSPWYFYSDSYVKPKLTYDYSRTDACLGIGDGANSKWDGKFQYKQSGWTFEGIRYDKMDVKRMWVLNALALGAVSLSAYRERFLTEFEKDFDETLFYLSEYNLLDMDDEHFDLFGKGVKERFAQSLFFFSYRDILEKRQELLGGNESQSIILGKECNDGCVFCFDKEPSRDVSITEQVKRIGEDVKEITFIGGEPTLYPNKLVKLCSYFSKKGMDMSIVTNGRALSSKKFTQELIENGLRTYYFSIHGDEKVNDLVTRADGAYKQKLEGIKNVLALGGEILVQAVVMRQNVHVLAKMVAELSSLGVKQFKIQGVLPKGAAAQNYKRFTFSFEAFQLLLADVTKLQKERGFSLIFEYIDGSYFEGYEHYMPDKFDILHFVGEFSGHQELYKVLGCGKAGCAHCFLDGMCNGEKTKLGKGAVVDRFNVDRIGSMRKVSLVEPVADAALYKEIAPRLSDVKKKLGSGEKVVDGIPCCIVGGEGIEYVRGNSAHSLYDQCRTRKVKSVRCKECVYTDSCDGVYVDYVKHYGFSELQPIANDACVSFLGEQKSNGETLVRESAHELFQRLGVEEVKVDSLYLSFYPLAQIGKAVGTCLCIEGFGAYEGVTLKNVRIRKDLALELNGHIIPYSGHPRMLSLYVAILNCMAQQMEIARKDVPKTITQKGDCVVTVGLSIHDFVDYDAIKELYVVDKGLHIYDERKNEGSKRLEILKSLKPDLVVLGSVSDELLAKADVLIVSGSTITNGTLEGMLKKTQAREIVVFGRSALLFPDVLFKRGVTYVSGALPGEEVSSILKKSKEKYYAISEPGTPIVLGLH